MKKYQIELNKKQLSIMQESLEMFSRHLSGQLEYSMFPPSLDWRLKQECREDGDPEIKKALLTLKQKVFGLNYPNESYGIGSNPKTVKKPTPEREIAYEMYKMILKQFYDESNENVPENKKSMSVHSTEPLKYSKEPFIKIKKL